MNVEHKERNSLTPFRKVWFSLDQFSPNSKQLKARLGTSVVMITPHPPKQARLCGQNVIFAVVKFTAPIFTELTAHQYNWCGNLQRRISIKSDRKCRKTEWTLILSTKYVTEHPFHNTHMVVPYLFRNNSPTEFLWHQTNVRHGRADRCGLHILRSIYFTSYRMPKIMHKYDRKKWKTEPLLRMSRILKFV